MADKLSAQEQAAIDQAIQSFGKQKLTEEQESLMIQQLYERMFHSISLPEALNIVAIVTKDKILKEVKSMTDEQKVQTYEALDLK